MLNVERSQLMRRLSLARGDVTLRRVNVLPRLFVCGAAACLAVSAWAYDPVPLEGFADSINHWRNFHDRRDYPRYAPEQIEEIAENVLLCQRRNGGWPANEEPTRVLEATERAEHLGRKDSTDTTFDNRCTYTHTQYLAEVYAQTGDLRHREGALRGLAYILEAQYPSGGWPHSSPGFGQTYHPHITFADDIMPGVLTMLRRVESDPVYAFVPPELRQRVVDAIRRGDACILRLQVRDAEGRRTAWAGQYDAETLAPTQGRSFELPGIVARESVPVVEYLMRIERPSREVIAAVEGAIDFYQRAQIRGWRLETFEADPVRYRFHTSRNDRRMVEDASAASLWARFYELARPEPFLANRDGRKVYSLSEVERERRTGYDWYGTWPAQLVAEAYPAWRARLGLP